MNIYTILLHFEWTLRIVVAAICGSFIGYERSNRSKEAGIRTHSIISLGSALIMVVSKYGFTDVGGVDSSRVAAQIVSGVGFLGAGIIFVKHGTVSGLTTAAGMWATSGVGMCIGAGLYDIGVGTTLLILFIQTFLHKTSFKHLQTALTIYLEIDMEAGALSDIQENLSNSNISMFDIKAEATRSDRILLEIECNVNAKFDKEKFMEKMMQKPYTKRLSFS